MNKKVSFFLVSLLIALYSFNLQATVTVFKTVKKKGGDFSSLTAAVNAIPSDLVSRDQTWIIEVQDENIEAKPYVYVHSKTDINHSITIRSQSNLHPILRAATIRISNTSYVTLDGFKIIGTNYDASYGILIDNASYITIQNCDILAHTYGIFLYNVSSSLLLNNRVHNCDRALYLSYKSKKNNIQNNIIYHSAQNGIFIEQGSEQNSFQRNVLFNNPFAIQMESNSGPSNQFTDNILEDGPRGQFLIYINGALPQNTIFDFNTLYAPSSQVGFLNKKAYEKLSNWKKINQDLNSRSDNPQLDKTNPEFEVTKVFKTIQKFGGDFSSIKEALNTLPQNLVEVNQAWTFEIQDSNIYKEALDLTRKVTSLEHTIKLRVQEGQTPLIQPGYVTDAVRLCYIRYVTLEGLKIDSSKGARGIFVMFSKNCTLKNNTIIKGIHSGVTLFASSENTLIGNTIHHSQRGIEMLGYASANNISHNILYRNSCGIYMAEGMFANVIENNTLWNNTGGIYFYLNTGPQTKVMNNIIGSFNRGFGISFFRNIPSRTIINYNNIYLPNGNVSQVYGNYYRTLKNWKTYSAMDKNSISEDPLFASTTEGFEDFHLMTTARDGGRINQGAYGNTAEASKTPKSNGSNQKDESEKSSDNKH